MKILPICLCLLIVSLGLSAQTDDNLDFETLSNDKAKGWGSFGDGNHKISFDLEHSQKGKVAGCIESIDSSEGFKALAYNIPAEFSGKKIKLTGYLKTENVAGGFAGLWMRIDPQIAFDNMQSRGIKGTTDWKKYEIELDFNSNAKTIVFGGLLVGTGKIWVDNFEITVDGKPLREAPKQALTKAQKDREFDKGSNISITTVDNATIENLALLGRIWGFLKYYHPQIGQGNYNWDYELFRILPEYLNSKTRANRDKLLITWIDGLGAVNPCTSCKGLDEDAFLKPDLEWLKNNEIAPELSEKLHFIQKNRHQGTHFYIGMMPNVGNPEFKNENPYADAKFPDVGFRLLSLYRYWNIINYFFPYKHLMDKNWNTTLAEYIPKFVNASNELEYELATIQIIGDIKDTHANLWGGNDKIQEQRGDFFAPVHVRFIENRLVVDAFFDDERSKASGLQVGDVITHIDEVPIATLVEKLLPYYPASNQATRLRDISFDILRSTTNTLNLTIKRDGGAMKTTLSLYNQKDIVGYYRWFKSEDDKPSYKKLEQNIGYITLKNIKQEDIPDIREAFKDNQGIIIDIRNYPSAFMPFTLGTFLTSKASEFVKFTNGNVDYPGEFTFGKTLSIPTNGKTYQGKVVVLVNELSQSQAEYTTMAFRAGDNVSVVGSTTAGADGNVSTIFLPGGLRTMISGIGVYYPDGTETQRVGIVPDIEVKPTIDGIKNGRDELMERAIELINKSIQNSESIKD